MPDCKQLILSSIPDNNSRSHAFFSILLYCEALIDTINSTITIKSKSEILDKAERIVHNFYPYIEENRWDDFLQLSGDIYSILLDCGIDRELNFDFSTFVDENDKLTLLQTIFLINGRFFYNNDQSANSKGYNLEFILNNELKDLTINLLRTFNLELKTNIRPNSVILYTKNSNTICDIMVLLGASNVALDIQNTLAIRELRNSVNRQNNCFESNLDKTLNASNAQLNAITYLMDNDYFDTLDESLKEVALARIANPDISLNDLRQILNINITRAGIKYRLDKIINIYKTLKGDK